MGLGSIPMPMDSIFRAIGRKGIDCSIASIIPTTRCRWGRSASARWCFDECVYCLWNGIIILMALLKGSHHSRSLSDLVKISFKDSNFLSNSGRNICTAPAECMEELLSAIQFV